MSTLGLLVRDLWPPVGNSGLSDLQFALGDLEISFAWPLNILVFLKKLRTTGLAVRNTPLTNIPKGFSSEMTKEVA